MKLATTVAVTVLAIVSSSPAFAEDPCAKINTEAKKIECYEKAYSVLELYKASQESLKNKELMKKLRLREKIRRTRKKLGLDSK